MSYQLPETQVWACIRVETGAISHYEPTEAIARKNVGTVNLRSYRFEPVMARVVFVVVDTEWDGRGAYKACLTYEAAMKHAVGPEDAIEVWLVSE